mmetsp:Transcript_66487/g.111178  ORF Transcript_66487/g.111178 Transcript_66487/m.111178 type:complete len:202 (-) Transcript_66487:58-663(-)
MPWSCQVSYESDACFPRTVLLAPFLDHHFHGQECGVARLCARCVREGNERRAWACMDDLLLHPGSDLGKLAKPSHQTVPNGFVPVCMLCYVRACPCRSFGGVREPPLQHRSLGGHEGTVARQRLLYKGEVGVVSTFGTTSCLPFINKYPPFCQSNTRCCYHQLLGIECCCCKEGGYLHYPGSSSTAWILTTLHLPPAKGST